MAIVFPSNPYTGQTTYTGGNIWSWDGERWYIVPSSGFVGSEGYTGSLGYTGSIGGLGYTGSKGDQGPAGTTGLSGAAVPTDYQTFVTTSSPNYNLNKSVSNAVNIMVMVNGLVQIPFTDYTVSSNTITFVNNEPVGSDVEILYFDSIGYQGSAGYKGSAGDPGGNTGYTGSRGVIGYTGSVGAGYSGSIGSSGYTGSQGELGYTGSGGPGFTGSSGLAQPSYISLFAADGSALYDLDRPAASVNSIFVFVNGILQVGYNDYALAANNSKILFYNIPTHTSDIEIVYFDPAEGYRGSTGYGGSIGYRGSKGEDGAPGGSTGYTGSAGIDGYTGSAGTSGYTGSAGTSGFSGSSGLIGPSRVQVYVADGASSHGLDAVATSAKNLLVVVNGLIQIPDVDYTVSGNTINYTSVPVATSDVEILFFDTIGYMGSAGYKGSSGDPGGDTGYTGSIGYSGSEGIGYTGSAGTNGYLGSVGYTGSAGLVGSPTHNQTFVTTSTDTYTLDQAAGQPVSLLVMVNGLVQVPDVDYTLTNPTSLKFLNIPPVSSDVEVRFFGGSGFTGSTGFKGSAGDPGGAQGYTGSRGAGYDGSTGYVGSTGELGYTGSIGFTGSVGYIGSSGYSGSIGGLGYTGSKGDRGFTGSFGFTGSRGTLGGINYFYYYNANTSGKITQGEANHYFDIQGIVNATSNSITTFYIPVIDIYQKNIASLVNNQIIGVNNSFVAYMTIAQVNTPETSSLFKITNQANAQFDYNSNLTGYALYSPNTVTLAPDWPYSNGTPVVLNFTMVGDQGSTGYTGSVGPSGGYTGSAGANGAHGGVSFEYIFDNTIQDPPEFASSGYIKFGSNNSIYLSFLDNLNANTAYFIENSINRVNNDVKGFITLANESTPYDITVYSVNSAVYFVDTVNYHKIYYTYLSGNTTPYSNGDSVVVSFSIAGTRGSIGYRGSTGYTGSIGIGFTGSRGYAGSAGQGLNFREVFSYTYYFSPYNNFLYNVYYPYDLVIHNGDEYICVNTVDYAISSNIPPDVDNTANLGANGHWSLFASRGYAGSVGNTFNTIVVTGQSNLVALNSDVLQIVAGNNVILNTNNDSSPKTLTISSTGGDLIGYGSNGQVLTSNNNSTYWATTFFVGDANAIPDYPNYGDVWFSTEDNKPYMWVNNGYFDTWYDFLPPSP